MNRTAAIARYPQYWGGAGSTNGVILLGTEGWIWASREGMKTQPDSLMPFVIGVATDDTALVRSHVSNLLDAVRTGRPTISSIVAAAHDEMICQMGDIAVRLKRKPRWGPVKAQFIDDEQANRRLWRPKRSPWQV